MSFCSKYLDALKYLPLYDENISDYEHHQSRRVWESIKQMNFQSSNEMKSFFQTITVPIEGIPFKGKTDADFEYSSSLLEELAHERMMDETSSLIHYEHTKMLNDNLTKAILSCSEGQKRGLTAQLFLLEDWKRFRIRVSYNPFVRDDGIWFKFSSPLGAFRNSNSGEDIGKTQHIEAGHYDDFYFERKGLDGKFHTNAGAIEIKPANKSDGSEQIFSPIRVSVPWASIDAHIFDGSFDLITNWYDPEHLGRGPEQKFSFKIDPIEGGEHRIRNHANDWLYVSLEKYSAAKGQHVAKIYLAAPHENVEDGIAKAEAELKTYNQPTGIKRAVIGRNWHHAQFNAIMKTRYIPIDALKYDTVIARRNGEIAVDGKVVFLFDGSTLKDIEKENEKAVE